MNAERIPPRTWLFGGLASWAALSWILALFGMGGRIEPLPVDASLVTRLPQMSSEANTRVGPASAYAESTSRPPFSADRRAHAFFIEGNSDQTDAQGFNVVLSSVLITPGLQMVILEPEQGGESLRVKLGEEPKDIPGWRLAEVSPRSATFEGPEGRRTLELRVYTGGLQVPPAATTAETDNAARGGSVANNPPPPTTAPTPGDAATITPTPVGNDASVITPDQQMQLIRKRIEARRAQLRQQQNNKQTPPAGAPSTPPPER